MGRANPSKSTDTSLVLRPYRVGCSGKTPPTVVSQLFMHLGVPVPPGVSLTRGRWRPRSACGFGERATKNDGHRRPGCQSA